jgi:hypothetical protein
MNKTSQKKEANHQTPHSSITVSDKIVCEDDACIGKVAGPQSKPTVERDRQDKKRRKRQGTSMSVRGKSVCADDSCIGKI